MLQGDDIELRGLTSEEVAARVVAGQSNVNTDVRTKSVGQILAGHALTLFNLVNLVLAALVLLVGEWRNMLFMGVVVSNFAIGTFQEIRAKRMVDCLSILTRQDVRVLRDGGEALVGVDALVLDDLAILSRGDQIPADAVVVRGSATVNESLLTGESDAIHKEVGDELLSGSFVDSGQVVARVTRVGAQSYAASINREAKYVKPVRSEIQDTLAMIIRLATVIMAPLGIGLFASTVITTGSTPDQAVLSTVAALVGMIPQGLVLLTSTVFAIATTRLASRKVLVQQQYCVETLARVDTLCLDKTGTITSGHMEVSRVLGPNGRDGGQEVADALSALALIARASEGDANETARAVMAHVAATGVVARDVARTIPFDSSRKWSGCVDVEGRAVVMGAPQFVLGHDRTKSLQGVIRQFDELERVLVVAGVDGFDEGGAIVGEPRVLGFVGIRDEIRETAAQTVAFFDEQGVELRVISGDDPRTVSAIARAVGIPGADAYVDASTLRDEDELRHALGEARVFGRVTPQQKREMVTILQEMGHTVAMTGDGVNDVLALKRADCSVSMASGSAAARNVSEVVLADNDFAHMPEVVAEGRRSINNLERSASLFLVKTVFSAVLALICILLPPYPFIPVQMTLVSTSLIGIPSFVLALEPNHERVRGDFLARVLSRSLPASAAVSALLFVAILAGRALGLGFEQRSTICTVVTSAVGIALIVRISQPMTTLRKVLLVVVTSMVVVGCTIAAPFFHIASPSPALSTLGIVLGVVAVLLFLWLYNRADEDLARGGWLVRFARSLEEQHVRNVPSR